MSIFEAGAFLIDKPAGASSFYIVRKVRKALGIKKVGHAGTLDPFATGLLIVCAGRPATRLIGMIQDGEKEYLATLRLGIETTTLDPEGEIVDVRPVGKLTDHDVEACLAGFRGRQQQVPPAYSALKHKGKPLYHYARQGIEIEKPPRTVEIKTLEMQGGGTIFSDVAPELNIRVVCSKGTYIRTLGADIGRRLGCGAHLVSLRRVRSGCFSVADSVNGLELEGKGARDLLMAKMISVAEMVEILGSGS